MLEEVVSSDAKLTGSLLRSGVRPGIRGANSSGSDMRHIKSFRYDILSHIPISILTMPFEERPVVGATEKNKETETVEERMVVTSEGDLKTEQGPTVDEMLSRTEKLSDQLEEEVIHRYGGGFVTKLREKMAGWSEALLQKGEKTVDWFEKKGIPLPKSKLGMRLLSVGVGTAGSFIPGGAMLWGLSIVLWKREPGARKEFPSELATE